MADSTNSNSPLEKDTPLTVDQELDVLGLSCPMPLLKAKQALNRLPPGALLRVLATDPGSERDFAVFARQSGHELLSSQNSDGQYVYVLRKKNAG